MHARLCSAESRVVLSHRRQAEQLASITVTIIADHIAGQAHKPNHILRQVGACAGPCTPGSGSSREGWLAHMGARARLWVFHIHARV